MSVNPQSTLEGPCTWTGIRTGRPITTTDGRMWREWVDRKRCPKCGGPIKETTQ